MLPAWYQTVAFRILVGVVLFIVIAVVYRRAPFTYARRGASERVVIERTAELRESQRQLQQIAYCDTLTALPNRRMFMEEFRELLVLTGLQTGRFALLLIDLDRLKHINDTLGHDVGDALLIEAAIRLQAAVRKSDCVARLGGDEYAVLVTQNPAAADIEAVCKRIVDSFALEVAINGVAVKTSPSIGVAVYPDHGTNRTVSTSPRTSRSTKPSAWVVTTGAGIARAWRPKAAAIVAATAIPARHRTRF